MTAVTSMSTTGAGEPRRPPARRNRRKPGRRWVAILGYLIAIAVIAPYSVMVLVALMPKGEIFTPPIHVLPRKVDFSNFTIPFTQYALATFFKNSIIIAIGTVVLGLLVAIPAAYVLARRRFRGRQVVMLMLLMTQMLSPTMLILGIYQEFSRLDLMNNLAAVVAVNAAFTVAFAVFVLSDVFASIPFEIEEAAAVDGASRTRVLTRIVVPLSGPGIATAGLFLFAQAWNEFTLALTVLNKSSLTPLSVGIYQFYGQFEKEWSYLFATALMGAIPVIICFMYLERWLVKGLTSGSVK
jgi:multiple sugar transport system permease protein